MTAVYLILHDGAHSEILSSSFASETDPGYTEMRVPRLEAWYAGELPLSKIETALIVRFRYSYSPAGLLHRSHSPENQTCIHRITDWRAEASFYWAKFRTGRLHKFRDEL